MAPYSLHPRDGAGPSWLEFRFTFPTFRLLPWSLWKRIIVLRTNRIVKVMMCKDATSTTPLPH